jgi:hypothetical protein
MGVPTISVSFKTSLEEIQYENMKMQCTNPQVALHDGDTHNINCENIISELKVLLEIILEILLQQLKPLRFEGRQKAPPRTQRTEVHKFRAPGPRGD